MVVVATWPDGAERREATSRGPGSASESRRSAVGGTRPRARVDWSRQALEFLLQGPEFGGLRDRRPPGRRAETASPPLRSERRGAALSLGESRGRRSPSRTHVPRLALGLTTPRSPRSAASRPRGGAPRVVCGRGRDPTFRRLCPERGVLGQRSPEANTYHDFASDVRDDRPGLDSCLRALRKGDVLVVWKLDRAWAATSPIWGH